MSLRSSSRSEPAVWIGLALLAGLVVGRIDSTSYEVQGVVLVLMVSNFALNLPGRTNPIATMLATVGGMFLYRLGRGVPLNPAMAMALVPAFVAAFGGKLFGALLDTAAAHLTPAIVDETQPWHRRALSTRFLLAITLMAIAAVGVPPVQASLRTIGHPASNWLGMVWQVMTLLGWIGFTPLILNERTSARGPGNDLGAGPAAIDVAGHFLIVLVLATIHAVAIVTIGGMLFIRMAPSWTALAKTAFIVYLPLDFLAYLAIIAIGYASDMERHRREALQREGALRAESLDSRLAALRARLNPHFLFNALNSVGVLARAGKREETGEVVEGLTSLLRYVLDERRATVPLGDELRFVREYLAVQKVRFGERLRFEVSAAENMLRASVPQLLLQPIVENAVEHGVAGSLDGGRVGVAVTRAGDALVMTVDDDGPGVALEPAAGIGLSSTRERLARLFGERATLSLVPGYAQGKGTRVIIRIPYEEMRDGE